MGVVRIMYCLEFTSGSNFQRELKPRGSKSWPVENFKLWVGKGKYGGRKFTSSNVSVNTNLWPTFFPHRPQERVGKQKEHGMNTYSLLLQCHYSLNSCAIFLISHLDSMPACTCMSDLHFQHNLLLCSYYFCCWSD